MRYLGRITDWNDRKGFGFVTPNGGGNRAFAHVKAFERLSKRPATGDLVSYELQQDERHRFNAVSIRFAIQQTRKDASADNPLPRKAISTLFLAGLIAGWAFSRIPSIVPLFYGAMGGLTFLAYQIDKSAAMSNRWRTKESTLQFMSLLGGWPGALLAQGILRHKTRKSEFQLVFRATVVFNCVALAWLLASGRAAAIGKSILGS